VARGSKLSAVVRVTCPLDVTRAAAVLRPKLLVTAAAAEDDAKGAISISLVEQGQRNWSAVACAVKCIPDGGACVACNHVVLKILGLVQAT
jgi:hypothetical protein